MPQAAHCASIHRAAGRIANAAKAATAATAEPSATKQAAEAAPRITPGQSSSERKYVGSEACAKCHAAVTREWAASLHNKMMQPATAASVEGNFAIAKVEVRGATYLLARRAGGFYITESFLAGKPWEHRVDYTLGGRRIQHYLTTLPDGRIIVIPLTWDNVRKKWIDQADAANPEEGTAEGIETWNKTCFSCHVSRGEKNFDLADLRYHTAWKDPGVDCESCHGPGSEHVAKVSAARVLDADLRQMLRQTIVNPARLDATRSTMICAKCHSFRDAYAPGFAPGDNFYDYFLPVMQYRLPKSADEPYWLDGRPRWFANEALALWQSQCFLKGGATCVTCHANEHQIDVERDPRLRTGSNALCQGCHKQIAANVAAHTHHAAQSPGSRCVECHMPATVVSVHARIRDHAISIPAPANTIRHGIPNACNACHTDKDAEWAAQQVKAWWGDAAGQKMVRRADAFAQARDGNAAAVPGLLEILKDASQGPLLRANAAGYLGAFPNDPAAYDAVLAAFADAQPLVRATAAVAIRPRAAQRAAVAPKLASLLADPVATVRVSAAIALVAMGVREIPGEDGARFASAKELYRQRAELDADDAQQQLAAGRFWLLAGDARDAAAAFRASLKLDRAIPAQYDLARALAATGDTADAKEARQILDAIPRDDPQYAAAQQFLAALDVKEAQAAPGATGTGGASSGTGASSAAQSGGAAAADFADGQLLYQRQDYGAALPKLEEALKLAPQSSWATKAQIYRAVCLEKLARTQDAEAAIQALEGNPEARGDVDLQLAYVELLDETGRAAAALQRVDGIIASAPKAPMAYLWRARVLLELHRTDEAAKAAEECVRLLPDLAAGHNLLLRIYQMQGRSKEAAEQAAWLRDYQRRLESR